MVKIFFTFIISITFTLMFFLQAQAYIPSSKMILGRVVENAFKLPLFVEQDLTLTLAEKTISVKEQWLFESENSIRLIVRGDKDLKDQVLFQNSYSDLQRTSSISGSNIVNKMPRPLFEKMFFIKTSENLMKFLIHQGIVADEILRSQNFKKLPGNNGFQYLPESFLRFGRVGGVVAYVFGPAPHGEVLNPGFWVEQDQFIILKIRSATGEELRVEKPTLYSRGARWPKDLSYTWGGNHSTAQAQVQVISVKTAEAPQKQLFQKVSDKRTAEFERTLGKSLIEEFYQRFR